MSSEQWGLDSHIVWTYVMPIGVALIVLATGFVTLLRRSIRAKERLEFASEFREKFIAYCNSRGEDAKAYTWLTLNSARMQSEMGSFGVYEAFKPPAASYMIRNYQIISNMLPELRRYIDQNKEALGTLFGSTVDQYMKAIDEALLRYLGVQQERLKGAGQQLRNPAIWLRTGVEQILSTPLLVLVWFGVIGGYAVRQLQENIVFRAVAVLATLVGLASGIMTMVLGWEEFSALTARIL